MALLAAGAAAWQALSSSKQPAAALQNGYDINFRLKQTWDVC
jgi:hypothetical protein